MRAYSSKRLLHLGTESALLALSGVRAFKTCQGPSNTRKIAFQELRALGPDLVHQACGVNWDAEALQERRGWPPPAP